MNNKILLSNKTMELAVANSRKMYLVFRTRHFGWVHGSLIYINICGVTKGVANSFV